MQHVEAGRLGHFGQPACGGVGPWAGSPRLTHTHPACAHCPQKELGVRIQFSGTPTPQKKYPQHPQGPCTATHPQPSMPLQGILFPWGCPQQGCGSWGDITFLGFRQGMTLLVTSPFCRGMTWSPS